jgi:predicted ATPase/DNA-binding CsgD family transcriptional regulator
MLDGHPTESTGGAPWPAGLPAPRTALVGRTAEVARVRQRLLDPAVRLLTLTGPGGVGKTRLALQAAAEVGPAFGGAVAFVPLAAATAPPDVLPALARALGVPTDAPADAAGVAPGAAGEGGLLDRVAGALRARGGRPALVVLDNCEHVAPAAGAAVGALLERCPDLRVLATSRAPLALYGEHRYPVPPLGLPDGGAPATAGDARRAAAVALFVQRAAQVRPDFALTDEEAPAVAELCTRLEGLPLAIELAAAWMAVLRPRDLLARLEREGALPAPPGAPLDVPARQRSLRASLQWSHDLLPPTERLVFRRLAVFAGGASARALEAACAADDEEGEPVDVLGTLEALVDWNLARVVAPASGEEADEPRFALLDTTRAFAWEQLVAAGEAGSTPRRPARPVRMLPARERPPHRGPAYGTSLTLRQEEVARLIAQGLTNKEIARALVITEKTVGTHVEDIFNRLGFQSRAQVGAWVGRQRAAAAGAAAGAPAA